MTIYEYIVANGVIFNDLTFTAETRLAVNRMLKFNYRDKPMMYDLPADVAELVAMAMYDNQHKYDNMLAAVSYSVPADYTNKVDTVFEKINSGTQTLKDDGTVVNTGTQTLTDDGTVVNTGTQTVTDDGTTKNTGTQTVTDDGTTKNTGTQTVTDDGTTIRTGNKTTETLPVTTTESELGFDSGAFVDNKKTLVGVTKTTETDNALTSTVDMTNTRTDDLTNTVDLTNTRTDDLTNTVDMTNVRTDDLTNTVDLTKVRTDDLTNTVDTTNVRTDNLKENTTNGVKTEDVPVKIEALLKMYEATSKLLYRIIAEDLIMVLCGRAWD